MRTMAIFKFVPIGVLMAVTIGAGICGCGSTAATRSSEAIPTIANLSPPSTTVGGPGFTLIVLGSNFASSSVVRWNGSDRPTAFSSSSEISAQISASDIAATGTAAVTVSNSASGGGTSNAANFTISNPTPTITTISPNSVLAGGAGLTLTINGTNFGRTSIVNFGGTPQATLFFGSAQLRAVIPAAAIASAGTPTVTVTNPPPGGGTSNAVNFSITSGPNPVPTINSLDPSGAPVGGQSFTLSVSGSNFVASSVVRWNGSDQPTTVVSSCCLGPLLTAQIPASNIAATGTATVTVFNPAPGGGSSNTSTFTIAAGGLSPQSVAVDSSGKFAYVANEGDLNFFAGNVSMYKIDPTTGALTFIGSVAADFGSHSVAVDPSGKFVYVANEGDIDVLPGNVSMYIINAATGGLTSLGTINAEVGPFSVAVDPSGKFAYVANKGGALPGVSMYTINVTTGALTSIGTIAAGGRPVSVAVHPSGKFAYVVNGFNVGSGEADDLSMYTINTTSGTLTSVGTIAAGSFPTAIAIDPSGKFAYVTNSNSNDVSMYTINSDTGVLTSIGPIAAGAGPSSVAIDPTGKFAYVSNSGSNDVSMYTINTTTGVLTPMGTIAAELFPTSVAITPSGKFAYVTNSASDKVSIFSIDAATGALTLIGTISS